MSAPHQEDLDSGESFVPLLFSRIPRGGFLIEQSHYYLMTHTFDQVRIKAPASSCTIPPVFFIMKEGSVECLRTLKPKSCRELLFHVDHNSVYLGQDKTLNQLIAHFYWPGIFCNVRRWGVSFCECQFKSAIAPATTNWGPLNHSARGHCFVLVLVDYATRYLEAEPLPNTSARSVVGALFCIISLVWILKEILIDQSTTCMSCTLHKLYKLLGIKSIHTHVYHLQIDRLVKWFNQTFKKQLE